MKNYISFKLILLTILLILSTSCNRSEDKKREDVSDLDRLYSFVINSKVISDSLKKLKSYDTKLVVCYYKELKNHGKITLFLPTRYSIRNDYIFKHIEGLNVLFVDHKKKAIKKNHNDLKELLNQNIVTFIRKDGCDLSPYYKFIYCKKDSTRIKCYDDLMEINESIRIYKSSDKSATYNEEVFYPKCD